MLKYSVTIALFEATKITNHYCHQYCPLAAAVRSKYHNCLWWKNRQKYSQWRSRKDHAHPYQPRSAYRHFLCQLLTGKVRKKGFPALWTLCRDHSQRLSRTWLSLQRLVPVWKYFYHLRSVSFYGSLWTFYRGSILALPFGDRAA